MIHLTRITRRYQDRTAPARREMTARLAKEIASERSHEGEDRHETRVRASAEYRQQGGQ